MAKTGVTTYADAFRIGFLMDDKDKVSAAWQSLKDGGIDVSYKPAKIRDTFDFYFETEGIIIEVSAAAQS